MNHILLLFRIKLEINNSYQGNLKHFEIKQNTAKKPMGCKMKSKGNKNLIGQIEKQLASWQI